MKISFWRHTEDEGNEMFFFVNCISEGSFILNFENFCFHSIDILSRSFVHFEFETFMYDCKKTQRVHVPLFDS